jgi:hypothetical protein
LRGFYCMPAPRIWRGAARYADSEGPQPDPYSRDAPGYRERVRETVTEIGQGLTRIDIGQPLQRLPSEPQPVEVSRNPEPQEEPSEATPAPAVAPPNLAAIEAAARNWRDDYGLLKRS